LEGLANAIRLETEGKYSICNMWKTVAKIEKPRRNYKKGIRNGEEFQNSAKANNKYTNPLPLWYTNNNSLENAI